MRLTPLAALLLSVPCWAFDCVDRADCERLCPEAGHLLLCGGATSGGAQFNCQCVIGAFDEPTTHWLNDESKVKHDECVAAEAKRKAEHEACLKNPPQARDGYLSGCLELWFSNSCETAITVGGAPFYFILPDGSSVEFGLRSDGVVTWRKISSPAAAP